jgi:predicted nucleotide-binding protein
MDRREARRLLEKAGISITNETRLANDSGYRLDCKGGEIVNVFDSGKVSVQGARMKEVGRIFGLTSGTAPPPAPAPKPKSKVFVVYGHDPHLRDGLEAMLRRWDLEPVILDQLPSAGATVIEKLVTYLGENDVRYGVVLATPDDEGHPRGQPTKIRCRVRQNVVLELGMLLMKLGRKRVAVLLKDPEIMEKPSDIEGVVYIGFKDSIKEVTVQLVKELDDAGIHIDTPKL